MILVISPHPCQCYYCQRLALSIPHAIPHHKCDMQPITDCPLSFTHPTGFWAQVAGCRQQQPPGQHPGRSRSRRSGSFSKAPEASPGPPPPPSAPPPLPPLPAPPAPPAEAAGGHHLLTFQGTGRRCAHRDHHHLDHPPPKSRHFNSGHRRCYCLCCLGLCSSVCYRRRDCACKRHRRCMRFRRGTWPPAGRLPAREYSRAAPRHAPAAAQHAPRGAAARAPRAAGQQLARQPDAAGQEAGEGCRGGDRRHAGERCCGACAAGLLMCTVM